MGLTNLIAPSGLAARTVKVKILADTVISSQGRGVPVFSGSVIEVSEYDAASLFGSFKAEKAKPEDKEHLVENPHRAIETAHKNRSNSKGNQ